MDIDFRTLLRVFLVVGGAGYVLWGVLDGSGLFVGMGLLAVVVGAIGLWRERSGQ